VSGDPAVLIIIQVDFIPVDIVSSDVITCSIDLLAIVHSEENSGIESRAAADVRIRSVAVVDSFNFAAGYFIKSFIINSINICHGLILHFLPVQLLLVRFIKMNESGSLQSSGVNPSAALQLKPCDAVHSLGIACRINVITVVDAADHIEVLSRTSFDDSVIIGFICDTSVLSTCDLIQCIVTDFIDILAHGIILLPLSTLLFPDQYPL
jgi:hypothetical protein